MCLVTVVQFYYCVGMEYRKFGNYAKGEPKRLSEFDAVTGPLLEEEGKAGHLATFPYTVGRCFIGIRSVESCKHEV